MGRCVESLLELLVLALQVVRDIFPRVELRFKCFYTLGEIDCFVYEVLFFISQLVNSHQ